MRLMRNPRLKGTKDRPFTLTGDVIDLFSQNRKLQRVLAHANATAVSDSMTLKSDTIDLRVRNDLLDHAYAWGAKSRARAMSPSQNLRRRFARRRDAGPAVQLVRALRRAFAEGKPDTVRFRSSSRTRSIGSRATRSSRTSTALPPRTRRRRRRSSSSSRQATRAHSITWRQATRPSTGRRSTRHGARASRSTSIKQKVATVTDRRFRVRHLHRAAVRQHVATREPRQRRRRRRPSKPTVPSVVPLPPKKP